MKEKPQDKSECLKRAAEARRFARETGDSAEKADLFARVPDRRYPLRLQLTV